MDTSTDAQVEQAQDHNTAAGASGDPAPPWGSDEQFDAAKAWALICNLRQERGQLKATAKEQGEKITALDEQVKALTGERDEAVRTLAQAREQMTAVSAAHAKERLLNAAGIDPERYAPLLTGDSEEEWAEQVKALTDLKGTDESALKPDPAQFSEPAVDTRVEQARAIFGD